MDTLKQSEDLSRGLLQNLDNFSYVLQEEHRKMSHPRAHNNLVRIKKKKVKFKNGSAELSVQTLISLYFIVSNPQATNALWLYYCEYYW